MDAPLLFHTGAGSEEFAASRRVNFFRQRGFDLPLVVGHFEIGKK